MKKLLTLAAIFALIFAACDEEYGMVNSEFFGVWTANWGTDNKGTLSLNIASNTTWTLAVVYPSGTNYLYDGEWSGSGNSITLDGYGSRGSATLSDGKLILNQDWAGPVTSTLTKSGSSGDKLEDTTLKIRNESSKTISDVLWNNVSFKRDGNNANIISGTNVTKSVEAGSGYIFFKVGTTAYRTKDLVVVNKDNDPPNEFTFNDYTLVVNVISPDNTTITLGGL